MLKFSHACAAALCAAALASCGGIENDSILRPDRAKSSDSTVLPVDPGHSLGGGSADPTISPVDPAIEDDVRIYKAANLAAMVGAGQVRVDGKSFNGKINKMMDMFDVGAGLLPTKRMSYTRYIKDKDGKEREYPVGGALKIYNGVYGSIFFGRYLAQTAPKAGGDSNDAEWDRRYQTLGVAGRPTHKDELGRLSAPELLLPDELNERLNPPGYVEGGGAREKNEVLSFMGLGAGEKGKAAGKDEGKVGFDPRFPVRFRYQGVAYSNQERTGWLDYVIDYNKQEGAGIISGIKKAAGKDVLNEEIYLLRTGNACHSGACLNESATAAGNNMPGSALLADPMRRDAKGIHMLKRVKNVMRDYKGNEVASKWQDSVLRSQYSDRGLASPGDPNWGLSGIAVFVDEKPKDRKNLKVYGDYEVGIFGPRAEEILGAVYFNDPDFKDATPEIAFGGYNVNDEQLRAAYESAYKRNKNNPKVTIIQPEKGGNLTGGGAGK